ncbi:hypothetical protein PSHT_16272 [Puccinia striiformis]|uniref:Uncharacterized protein n=1 Tax=Puccinia striiformis TaxID=27350 RepID=A0A2S4UB01_9BASI|nr:hypothetical protein PSHT_16272 [Puccinia striiformis]
MFNAYRAENKALMERMVKKCEDSLKSQRVKFSAGLELFKEYVLSAASKELQPIFVLANQTSSELIKQRREIDSMRKSCVGKASQLQDILPHSTIHVQSSTRRSFTINHPVPLEEDFTEEGDHQVDDFNKEGDNQVDYSSVREQVEENTDTRNTYSYKPSRNEEPNSAEDRHVQYPRNKQAMFDKSKSKHSPQYNSKTLLHSTFNHTKLTEKKHIGKDSDDGDESSSTDDSDKGDGSCESS